MRFRFLFHRGERQEEILRTPPAPLNAQPI